MTWDAENRLTAVLENSTTIAQFFYDGDGNRVKKIENGETIVYINQYYEVNLTSGNATSYYYLGGKLIAMKENTALQFVHQDHLTSTSLMTSSSGVQIGDTVKYLPFGETRAAIDIPTDKLFTGQRLDSTGLYYYNARYYDPTIGRFISADTIIPNWKNPQAFNRYSYCINNPLILIDPSGHGYVFGVDYGVSSSGEVIDFEPERPASYNPGMDAATEIALWNAYYATHAPAPITMSDVGVITLPAGVTTTEVVAVVALVSFTRDLINENKEGCLSDEVILPEEIISNLPGGVSINEDIKIKVVANDDPVLDILNAVALSFHPGGIVIKKEQFEYGTKLLVNLLAEELFHWWEQSNHFWWMPTYIWECMIFWGHDSRPSEKRAMGYADKYFPN